MPIFYFFAAIVIWLGILSLRSGFRFAKYVQLESARPLAHFTPFASIVVPCRGIDQDLHENLEALFNQDYPAYEIIFVTDNADDLSLSVFRDAAIANRTSKKISTRVVIAGEANDSGQKAHNLRAAVGEIDPQSEALVFVDSDARPQRRWLRSLVEPLHDKRIGAATGYRWFIPVSGGLASHLRSVWNASITSALGEREDQNFCWGGSTAIRRETFEELNIRERWRGTVSDDLTMTKVLKEANLTIRFVPACLTASLEDCTLTELFEFTTRQLKITRVYASHLWKPVLIGGLMFNVVFFGGIAITVTRAVLGLSFVLLLAPLLIIFALGAAKAYVRLQAVSIPLAIYRNELSRDLLGHLVLWPVASALYLYNAVAAGLSRRIRWRGIVYELKSPVEAVIISRE
jgi:cellulose synthase/poly-beta-1,6-N-acetylglucosamine synthase-like glycosyltransferase